MLDNNINNPLRMSCCRAAFSLCA